jgi:hypothetical protein
MFEDAHLIHGYTRADALRDGVSPGTTGRLRKRGWRGKGRRSCGVGLPPRTSRRATR